MLASKVDPESAICATCGGPAEVETFWSTSPDRPGYRVLKRKTACAKASVRRGYRARFSQAPRCAILIEELTEEAILPPIPLRSLTMSPAESHSPEESPRPVRGRVPAEVRSQILEFHSQGLPLESIAEKTQRSVATIRKIVGEGDDEGQDDSSQEPLRLDVLDLDDVIEFLSDLPEEAMDEILQLARLQRERRHLRSSLEIRLRDLRRS